ncbi:MAG: hypothetical protein IKW59_07220 [Clostridia bacterium]|nr:hypothetical protein [Clostridia bacterium]
MKKIAIVYGELKTDIQKKALEQISSVILEQTITYPVCVKYSDFKDTENFRCIYIGTKKDNPYIAKESKKTLTKEEEYYISVTEDRVIIEGYDDAGVLYGCADFYNKYIIKFENRNLHGGYFLDIFAQEKLPEYECVSSPSVKNRGIWTWGHVIYNYKGFIDNMLKLKLNTIIIWNDFVPVNADEMIAYAHSCNVKVIWGFSWLWDVNCALVDMNTLYDSIDGILEKFEKQYSHLNVDGIYFQSFTELATDKIGDVLVADAVTKFVNEAAARFFDKFGEMELQFGIHATSVKEKLDYIKNVDPRVRLYWEDCGSFPFAYIPKDIENYEETKDFVIKTTHLRENEKYGAVTKGIVCLDWGEFEHLAGSFYIGKCSKKVTHNRVERKNRIWRYMQSYWLANADKAYDMVKTMCEETGGDLYITALVEDGMFEENVMYPVAIYSEMLWDTNNDIKEMISQVALRSYVEFA